jgi:hypothetical protein
LKSNTRIPQQPANIVFVDPASIKLSPNSSGSFKLDVALKNADGAEGVPPFDLRGVEDAKCDQESLVAKPEIRSIGVNKLGIAHFNIKDIELPATCYLELVKILPTR